MGVHAMGNLLVAAVALAGAVAASPAAATVTVLDFSGAACVDGPDCATGESIAQSYGDSAGVDVSYATYLSPAGDLSDVALRYWEFGCGDLTGVVWGGSDGTNFSSRITLKALPGYEIALLSFDIATFAGASAQSPVLIESLGGTSIFAGQVLTLFPTHNQLAVNSAYFTDGIALNWGPDGFNVGLDNITFDVRARPGTAVPEPATWAMLIVGFAAAGGMVRRRAVRVA